MILTSSPGKLLCPEADMSDSGSPGLPPPHPLSQMYLEFGRYYGTFKKGKYMFPIDEVGSGSPGRNRHARSQN